jgi:hypothetical protein
VNGGNSHEVWEHYAILGGMLAVLLLFAIAAFVLVCRDWSRENAAERERGL